MVLAGDTSAVTAPGQFINIRLDGHFLRRPVSVNDVKHAEPYTGEGLGTGTDEGAVTIIYKVLGQGTEEMTKMPAGTQLDVPAKELIKEAKSRGMDREVTVILGFNSSEEIYYADEFEELGCRVAVATADGSEGVKGFVTDAFRVLAPIGNFTHFYTCGPEPMLKAVYEEVYKGAGISGQMSFEERMGCGFGACMGCSCRTVTGYKRICKDGPVLRTEEILW